MHLVLLGSSAVSNSIDHNLRSEKIVAAPFGDICPLTLVPLSVSECVGPAEMVEVGNVVSKEDEIWIFDSVLDFWDIGQAGLTALGLEELDDREGLDINKAGTCVDMGWVVEGDCAG